MIQQRMVAILNEYSQLPQFDRYDLQLEAVDSSGAVQVTITDTRRPNNWMKKLIKPNDSLDFVGDTFGYPNTYSVRSKDIAPESVKRAYFDIYGTLIVEHPDSVEAFKVKPANKDEVVKELSLKLGSKFTKEIRVADPNSQVEDNV